MPLGQTKCKNLYVTLLTLLVPKSVGRTVSQPRARGSHFSASPWTPAGYRIAPERSKRALTIYKRFRIKFGFFRSRGALEVGGLPLNCY